MTFVYFRFVLTLLACFAAFFAYVCRLNLSLTIDVMVVKSATPADHYDLEKLNDDYEGSKAFLYTEEHTLALYSKSSGRIRSGRRSKSSKVMSKISARPLVVDFDPRSLKTFGSTLNDLQVGQQQEEVATEGLDWSDEAKNSLLGAFFFGYVVFQIPSARAAEIFGAKSLFLLAGFGASLCTLVFPLAAKSSPPSPLPSIIFAYIVRVIMGATQGALFPAAYVFLCEWLPKNERSTWLPYPSAFSRIGAIVMNLLVPQILDRFGWECVFYISGFSTLAWCLLFIVFGANTPSESYWISKRELVYIESRMEPRVGTPAPPDISASGFAINESAIDAKPSVSWLRMASNKAILILTLVMFTSEWSNMLLLIKLPGFLGPVLKMNLTEIGNYNSILIIVYCVQYPLSGLCASKLEALKLERLDSLNVRKLFEATAHAMQAAGCFMIAFSDNKIVVLSALILMMLGRSTVGGGQCLMPPELSKEYPGTVFAFSNTIANTAGIIGPLVITWMVSDPKEHQSWSGLWILSGSLFLFGGLMFCLFAENSQQNYNKKPKASRTMSKAQLNLEQNPEQIFKMEAFARVSSDPSGRAAYQERRID